MQRKQTPAKGLGAKGLGGAAARHRKILRNNIDGITKPVITRAGRRAGAIRIESAVYDQMRSLVLTFMEKLMFQAMLITEYERKLTVSFETVNSAYYFAFGRCYLGGENTPITGGISEVRRVIGRSDGVRRKSGTSALGEIRFYQKHSDSTFIPYVPMSRLVKEMGQKYTDLDIRYSEKAICLIRFLLEEYMVALLKIANDLAIHAGRKTVEVLDLKKADEYCR